MRWQLIVDFDGTVSIDDTTDLLLQRFADPAWQAVEEEWLAGRIGSRECMSRQVALLRATREEFEAFVDKIAIDWHFKSFVRLCQRLDVPLTIVSDGLDWVIRSALRRAGLESLAIAANHLVHLGGRAWRLESPYASPACRQASGTCKCSIAAGRAGAMTLVIGDGRSDRCVAEAADFVFAKSGLVAFCEERQLPFKPFRDFAEASALLTDLLETTGAEPLALDALKEPIYG